MRLAVIPMSLAMKRIVRALAIGAFLASAACSNPARQRSNAVRAGTFDVELEREGEGSICRGALVLLRRAQGPTVRLLNR